MFAKIALPFIINFIVNGLAATQERNCNDCIVYYSCDVSVALLRMRTPAADVQLKKAFCGFHNKLPMVCCSELTLPIDGVEDHPNLNLLLNRGGKKNKIGGNCNDCIVYYSCDVSVALLRMKTPEAVAQLKKAFCGFHNKLPMVCCSELSLPIDGVEGHPNLSLLPNRCGKNNKIGGGRPARRHELPFPWMVLLAYETPLGPQFKCSGSLINERYVLTVAHCLSDSKLIGVRVGELDVNATTACDELDNCQDMIQDLRIEEAIPHPEYRGRPNVRNDIGLLRLWRPVDLSLKNIREVCLPVTREQQNRDLGGQLAMIAGRGFTEKGYISSVLRYVDVSIYTTETCRQLYNRGRSPNAEDETTNKLCAGQKSRGSCDGDSGGPLVVTDPEGAFVQYGVDSYGPTLCGADFPTAYTDVTKYMKWILDMMRQ